MNRRALLFAAPALLAAPLTVGIPLRAMGRWQAQNTRPHTEPKTATEEVVAMLKQVGSRGAVTIEDVGTLPGGSYSTAQAINDEGHIVGSADRPGAPVRAFLWEAGTGIRDLGTLTGTQESRAVAINDRGQVVGTSSGQAFLWDGASGLRALPPLDEFQSSSATGINELGQVAGFSSRICPEGQYRCQERRATLWTEAGIPRDLGNPTEASSAALAINDWEQIVGWTGTPTLGRPNLAVLWERGKDTAAPQRYALGTLPRGTRSAATAINASGQVVGWSAFHGSTAPVPRHAFLWTRGMMQDLGSLPGSSYSTALAMDDHGAIVGYCAASGPTAQGEWTGGRSGGMHACLWIGQSVVDLNQLLPPGSGWLLTEAQGINNRGQIVGTGTIGGFTQSFLLSLPNLTQLTARLSQRHATSRSA